MSAPLRRLVQQGSLYAVGNVLMKGAGFLLALLYLDPAYLSQSAFGVWGTLDAAAKVAVPFLGLGLTVGLLRFWAEPTFADDRAALQSTALVATAALAVVGGGLIIVGAPWIAVALLGDEAPPEATLLLRLIGGLVAVRTVYGVPAALIRIHERAGLYVVAIAGEMAVLLVGTYYLLVVRGAGLTGVVAAHLAAATVSALVLVGGALRSGWAPVRPDLLRRLVRFGLPLAAAGVGTLLLNLGDRFLLLRLADAETTAVYDWSGRLGSLLYLLVVSSFNAAFSVIGIKTLRGDPSQTALHRRVFRHFVAGAGWAALGLSLAAYDVTRLISPNPAFLEAETLVAPIAAGYLLYGVYFLMVNILFVGDRTRSVAANLVGATALNVALNVALIPAIGSMGAALATALSYAALVALTARAVRDEADTRFDWSLLALVLLVGGGLYGLGHLGLDWPTPARIASRAALVGLYPVLLVALRIYRWDEVRALAGAVRGWVRR